MQVRNGKFPSLNLGGLLHCQLYLTAISAKAQLPQLFAWTLRGVSLNCVGARMPAIQMHLFKTCYILGTMLSGKFTLVVCAWTRSKTQSGVSSILGVCACSCLWDFMLQAKVQRSVKTNFAGVAKFQACSTQVRPAWTGFRSEGNLSSSIRRQA